MRCCLNRCLPVVLRHGITILLDQRSIKQGYGITLHQHLPSFNGIVVAGGVPSNAVVTIVAWTYSLSRTVAAQLVNICRTSDGSCLNISSATHGTTSSFAGGPANDTYYLRFGLTGSGTISPAIQCGYSDQFIVNYSY